MRLTGTTRGRIKVLLFVAVVVVIIRRAKLHEKSKLVEKVDRIAGQYLRPWSAQFVLFFPLSLSTGNWSLDQFLVCTWQIDYHYLLEHILLHSLYIKSLIFTIRHRMRVFEGFSLLSMHHR